MSNSVVAHVAEMIVVCVSSASELPARRRDDNSNCCFAHVQAPYR